MVTILDLIDDCTRHLFDHFSLNEMIHLRGVCPTWNALIIEIFSKKQTLYIFFDRSVVANYLENNILGYKHECSQITPQNTLIMSKQTKYFAPSPLGLNHTADGSFCELTNNPKIGFRFITRLFPNITNFTYEVRKNLVNELNYLLWKWSENLETLQLYTPKENLFQRTYFKVFVSEEFQVFEENLADFWQCFGQMSSLRQFHLVNSKFNNFELPNSNQTIETMGKLEEFTLDVWRGEFNCEMAPFYAQLKNCKHFRVGQCVEDAPLNVTQLNAHQTGKLTHLSINFHSTRQHSNTLISKQCDQFHNLSYLEVLDISHNCNIPLLTKIYQSIQTLQELKTLAIRLSLLIVDFEEFVHSQTPYNSPDRPFPIFSKSISELHIIDNPESLFPKYSKYSSRSTSFLEPDECRLLAESFPGLNKICIFSNKIDKATFDAQIRPLLSEAFGARVAMEFNCNR